MKRKSAVLFTIALSIILTGCVYNTPIENTPTDSSTTMPISDNSSTTVSTSDNNTSSASLSSDSTTDSTTISSVDSGTNASTSTPINPSSSSTFTYTVAEDPETKPVDTSSIKAGDYTVGGYLPTTANSKYKNNGLKYLGDGGGIMFRDGEEEDLYNWVSAGYTKWRTEDVRIASRKGGINNPRVATFLSLDNNDFWYFALDSEYCMVTVMTEKYNGNNNNISSDLRALVEKWIPNTNTQSKTYKEIVNYIDTHDLDKELNYFAGAGDGNNTGTFNTMVQYNCRNYCGDTIYITIDGEGTKKSNKDPTGVTSQVDAAAGIDYILTCDDDPTAFKLVKDEELKKMYESNRKGLKQYTAASAYSLNACYFDTSLDGSEEPYHQAYVGVKPGIYRCTVTIPSTGDKIPIVIENLPVHYEELAWGCTNQEEMDFCVQFMQAWENGVFGQYYHTLIGRGSANYFNVKSNKATYEDKLEAIKQFNEMNMNTFEGELIQLNNSEAAAEWASHLPHAVAQAEFEQTQGGLRSNIYAMQEAEYNKKYHDRCTKYDALDTILYGADDCESMTAAMQCLFNVLGYDTRVITGGSHMFFEVKVPANITKSGKEQWMMVDNGCIGAIKMGYMVKSNIYKEVKGLDNSWWQKCYNEDIRNGVIKD